MKGLQVSIRAVLDNNDKMVESNKKENVQEPSTHPLITQVISMQIIRAITL